MAHIANNPLKLKKVIHIMPILINFHVNSDYFKVTFA